MQKLPYAIIGAGPSGLATARALQKAGLNFIGFEKHGDVGGLWDINNPHSTMYKTAHLISSKTMTQFTEFPMKESTPDYPSHSELLAYFHDYSNHFDLKKNFIFNADVTATIKESDGTWKVTANGNTHHVAGIILATGTLHYPNLPVQHANYTGESIHSSEYKNPEIFKNKKVLIVGCGNSACDIAVDAIHHAKLVNISVRRGYHFVPKYIFGKPADTLGKSKMPPFIQKNVQKKILKAFMGSPENYGFPKPDHDLFESHPVVNSLILYHAGHGDIKVRPDIEKTEGKNVTFKNGMTEEYDMILWATGYKVKYPFIDAKLLNWDKATPDLYLKIFHPTIDSIFIVGMIEALGLGWQGRYEQADLVAQYLKQKETKSSNYAKFNGMKLKPIDLSGNIKYIKLDRMSYYVHKQTYLNEINKHKQVLNTSV
ncbi:MAG: NAD(P)-binding domain-containing protein [Bdellovibrionales bacterium]|nr:NAD(P)-binding domain-containing protein [Bdellovibrionales bacterium]